MKKTLPALLLAMLSFAATAQKSSRLLAKASSNFDGTKFYLADTTHYDFHSYDLGGDLNSRYIAFNNSVTYRYDTTLKKLNNSLRSLQDFDANKHLSMTSNYNWNTSIGAWVESTNILYTSTIDDSVLNETDQTWNTGKIDWENTNKEDYTYDAAKNKTSYTLSKWDEASLSWIGSEKTIYTYDAANNLTKKVFQKWNTGSSAWDDQYKDSFTYNTKNLAIQYNNVLYTGSTAKNNRQSAYTYDASDFLVDQVESGWNASTSSWYNVQHFIFSNDSKGHQLTQTIQNWNTTSSTWDNFRRHTHTYDGSGNILNDKWEFWDKTGSLFANESQTIYTFGAASNMLTKITATWDIGASKWVYNQKDSFAYNSRNQLTYHSYYTIWDGLAWKNNVEDQQFNYYYEEYAVGIKENAIALGTLNLYPVPTKNNLNISLHWNQPQAFRVRISDITGKTLSQWTVGVTDTYTQNIDISNLGSGQYFIELNGSKEGLIQRAFTVAY